MKVCETYLSRLASTYDLEHVNCTYTSYKTFISFLAAVVLCIRCLQGQFYSYEAEEITVMARQTIVVVS